MEDVRDNGDAGARARMRDGRPMGLVVVQV